MSVFDSTRTNKLTWTTAWLNNFKSIYDEINVAYFIPRMSCACVLKWRLAQSSSIADADAADHSSASAKRNPHATRGPNIG